MQLFPERDRRGRRFLALAIALSVVLHFAGGSLWGLLLRVTHTVPKPEEVASTSGRITIEKLPPPPSPTPTPRPTPAPTPTPSVVQAQPHQSRPSQQTPRRRLAPRLAQPTFAPAAEPTAAPRVAQIHVPRAQRVAVVRVPRGVHGNTKTTGALDIGALDASFRKTIAQAQHDVETTPAPSAVTGTGTMKRYDRYLTGNIDDVTGANGFCDPIDEGSYHGAYVWYFLHCTVRYADGYVETVDFPWQFRFARSADPFAHRDGRRHEFPGQPPPDGFVLPHPFAMSRAVCTYFRAECKEVIDRERANGDLPE